MAVPLNGEEDGKGLEINYFFFEKVLTAIDFEGGGVSIIIIMLNYKIVYTFVAPDKSSTSWILMYND